jgi:hypothetical protein
MNLEEIDTISTEDFDAAITDYISWANEWDGALPADTFFGVWADLQTPQAPVSLKVKIIDGKLQFAAPPGSPIQVTNNRIFVRKGLELIIDLDSL